MGETAIDEETFDEYLDQMRDRYTADKVSSECSYHLEYRPMLTGKIEVSFVRYTYLVVDRILS